jgi:2',3'-cyclic-nucleotide 2'-phosphodiesterase (5'-nucleotidase family)
LPALPDAAVAAFVDSVQRITAPLARRVVGRTARGLDMETLAQLAAAALRRVAQADVAVTNLGGIRTDLEPGDITEADVFEMVPFENTLVTAWMRGAALSEFIACNPHEARLAGLRWQAPPADDRAAGGPAAPVPVRGLVDDAGKPLDPDREYLVVTNNFVAQGGDGFRGFLAGRDVTWTELRVRDIVRAALSGSPVRLEAGEKKKSGDFKGG